MSIPASRINLCTNSGFEVSTAGWSVFTNATVATSATQFYEGAQSMKTTVTATGVFSVATPTGTSGVAVLPNTAYNFSAYLRAGTTGIACTPKIAWYNSSGSLISTSSGSAVTDSSSAWSRCNVQATSPSTAAYASLTLSYASGAAATFHYADAVLFEKTTSLNYFFNGDTTWDASNFHSYSWSGAAGLSASSEDYYGVWVELATTPGMPSVNVFATGLGASAVTASMTRLAAGDTWTVPGWRSRNVIVADTTEDWYVPYGVLSTYTLTVNGNQINSMSITVNSTSGYVCDPLQPDQAMPVSTTGTSTATLTLANPALGSLTYDPHGTAEYPMGGAYPIGRAGQRSAAVGVSYIMYAHQNDVSDGFKNIALNAPVLLFKSLPSWGSIPPLGYTMGAAVENPINRGRIVGNLATTMWTVAGDLIQPTTRPPVTGTPTYNDVATYLGSRTYNSVLSANSSRTYVDIKANPLSL